MDFIKLWLSIRLRARELERSESNLRSELDYSAELAGNLAFQLLLLKPDPQSYQLAKQFVYALLEHVDETPLTSGLVTAAQGLTAENSEPMAARKEEVLQNIRRLVDELLEEITNTVARTVHSTTPSDTQANTPTSLVETTS